MRDGATAGVFAAFERERCGMRCTSCGRTWFTRAGRPSNAFVCLGCIVPREWPPRRCKSCNEYLYRPRVGSLYCVRCPVEHSAEPDFTDQHARALELRGREAKT